LIDNRAETPVGRVHVKVVRCNGHCFGDGPNLQSEIHRVEPILVVGTPGADVFSSSEPLLQFAVRAAAVKAMSFANTVSDGKR